jgi:hypothetical protein
VSTTPAINCSPESTPLALFCIFDTGNKFIASVVVTGDNCSLVSLIPGKIYHRRSLFIVVVDAADKFIAGDNDTSDNCSAGVNNTGDKFIAGINDTAYN